MLVARVVCYLILKTDTPTVNTACSILIVPPTFRYSNTAVWLLLDRHLRVTIAARKLSSVIFGFSSWCEPAAVVRIVTLSTSWIARA